MDGFGLYNYPRRLELAMNAVEEMSPATGDISPRYAEKTPPHAHLLRKMYARRLKGDERATWY